MGPRIALLAWLAFFGICSCAPQVCDPKSAGFFGGVNAAATGCYQQRQQALVNDLATTRAQGLAERENAAQASTESTLATHDLIVRQQRLAELDEQVSILRQAVTKSEESHNADRRRLEQVKSELADLQRDEHGNGISAENRISNERDISAVDRLKKIVENHQSGLLIIAEPFGKYLYGHTKYVVKDRHNGEIIDIISWLNTSGEPVIMTLKFVFSYRNPSVIDSLDIEAEGSSKSGSPPFQDTETGKKLLLDIVGTFVL